MITDYEFNNYLTLTNLDEVVQRVRNILGAPGVRFAVAQTFAGGDFPDLYTHQSVEEDFLRVDAQGFTVLCPGTLQFGANAYHSDVTTAMRAANAGREHTFVTVTGGNGQSGLLNQKIVTRGLNQYGVPFSTVVKVEDYSTEELVDNEVRTLEKVADLLAGRCVSEVVVQMLRRDAVEVRETWQSRLGGF